MLTNIFLENFWIRKIEALKINKGVTNDLLGAEAD